MERYFYINGGVPFVFDSEGVPKLEENERLMHIFKIATAFEREGIEGVCIVLRKGEGDRFNSALLTKSGSLGEMVLKFIADEAIKTRRMPTVGQALAIAKLIQKREAAHYE